MEDDQEKLLQQASNIVKTAGFQMQKASDTNNTQDVIKFAIDLLSELKTSSMSPKTYYELYMQIFDQLSRLEGYFMQEYRRQGKIAELFEKVQHATSILPRLYLLVTVGSVYINTNEISAKDMLKDLMEMVKGVQHPIRGLFLRYYLNKMSKDKLPDSLSDASKGELTDSVEFLLNNFSEMCRLWVRMQHTGGIKDKTKREKERSDLKVTVGENIVRLSNLEGITLELYSEIVLPRSLEVILSSKDAIAQEYLMDCMIQAFPDRYHLHTLNALLETTTQLQPSVDIKGIFIKLLNRLSDFAEEADLEIVERVDIFSMISTHVEKLLAENSAVGEISKFLQLFVAFLRLSLRCYPTNTNHVNSILDSSVALIEKEDSGKHLDSESLSSVLRLLSFPLESLGLEVLAMRSFPKLMTYLQYAARKKLSLKIVKSIISLQIFLTSPKVLTTLLEYTSSLLLDTSDAVESEALDAEEEQEHVARLAHMIRGETLEDTFAMLMIFKDKLSAGGVKRQVYTYPSLIFALIRLASYVTTEHQVTLAQIVKVLTALVQKLTKINPELGLKLSLQCAQCINAYDRERELEEIAYEFAADALVIFQDSLASGEAKFNAIKIIAANYAHFSCFGEENAMTLSENCAQFASKTLRRDQQVEGNMIAARLFWTKNLQDQAKVATYMGRGVKLAAGDAEGRNCVGLIMAYNNYAYFSMFGNHLGSMSEMVDIIKQKANEEDKTYFRNTVSYVRASQGLGKLKDFAY